MNQSMTELKLLQEYFINQSGGPFTSLDSILDYLSPIDFIHFNKKVYLAQ